MSKLFMARLVIIDASSFFYRAFFALPTDASGTLSLMLSSALDFLKPDEVIVALDSGRETFRNQIYPGYKANRPPSPEGYAEALPGMQSVFSETGYRMIGVKGYEADDVIGTLCAQRLDAERIILSRDKDLYQLVSDGVCIWDNGYFIEEKQVWEKFGVRPDQVVDVLALDGDKADNIPGVSGVGLKTASELIARFENLDELYSRIGEVSKTGMRGAERIQKLLIAGKDNAYLSKQLATIKCDVILD